jgi:hypothetical protein
MDDDDELLFQVRRPMIADDEPRKEVALPVAGAPVARVEGISFACPFEQCGMRFTSQRWLDVHENETHSPFWNGRFACLVCDKDFKSDSKRYFHLVAAHAFPEEWSSKSLHRPPRVRPRNGQENEKQTVDKKSVLCRYFKSGEACPRGADCWYAHSKADTVPDTLSFGHRKKPSQIKSSSAMDISE